MNRQEQLHEIVAGLTSEVVDIKGAILASRDGLAIASSFEGDDTTSRVAAMAATVFALGARVVESTGLGTFEETVIQSADGVFVAYNAGDRAVLALLARPEANLGLVHLEARRTAEVVAHLIAAFRAEAAAAQPAPQQPVGAPTPLPTADVRDTDTSESEYQAASA